ncbi:MAG: hypothetical protein HKN70_12630, partial [Gammaproteobacteria bacterium]|nr:hypothetical protein [Gammaproteobacteria bacterium]
IDLGLNQMREDVGQDLADSQFMLGRSATALIGLSDGYMSWLLRGGVLLSSALSSLPVWRFVDPLPVFVREDEESAEDGDDESLEAIVQGGEPGITSVERNTKPSHSPDPDTR